MAGQTTPSSINWLRTDSPSWVDMSNTGHINCKFHAETGHLSVGAVLSWCTGGDQHL